MRILVTGSHGFVGKHVVTALLDRGDEVVTADKVTGIDLSDPWTVEELVMRHRPDAIIHLAATCSTPASVDRPMETFHDTVLSGVYTLEAARQNGIPFLLTSSVKARDGMTPYGAAKRMVEAWATEYRSAYHFPVVINRPGTIYGPGQEGSPESGWIAWFLKAERMGRPIIINGDGTQVRDLLHVSDYVRLLLIQLDDIAIYDGGIWDVGGGRRNAVTVNEMAAWLGLKNTHGLARYGDAQEYIGVNDVPGWQPEVYWKVSETLGDLRHSHPVAQ